MPAPAKPTMPKEYREMLLENVQSYPSYTGEEGRSIKKRRIGGRVVLQGSAKPDEDIPKSGPASLASDNADPELHLPLDIYLSDSDDSAADEMDWEEVAMVDNGHENAQNFAQGEAQEDLPLDIVLGEGEGTPSRRQLKRKPTTAAEKKLRIEIHKMHVLCLLSHISLRNHWCNDVSVQRSLRHILSKKTVSLFHLDVTSSQHKRSAAFIDGLSQAMTAFANKFKITARGMSRAMWADSVDAIADLNIPDDIDLPMQRSDFEDAATALAASRDVGAQLFCTILRGIGVEARLVCSLQVLPFSGNTSLRQPSAPVLPMISYEHGLRSDDLADRDDSSDPKSMLGATGGRNRYERPCERSRPSPIAKSRKRIIESSYPVYWIEAFDEAQQKWIAVDPLVTKTVGKPSRLEPPASDPENHLTYVVAFEDDGSARDVTQRYTKAFNAKTRKERIEVMPQGDKWWKRTMRLFRRKQHYDRDQIEYTQLAARLAQEGMPSNVQDFKDHPFYVLERHLRKHEVIHPKREVGKVGVGRVGGEKLLEPVYRRQNVQSLKSADKWYRQGRQIKAGEQPLKRITARRPPERKGREDDLADTDDEDDLGVGLYSVNQTVEYQPAPVIDGKIPKNAYGNLDVYTPSMIPPGASHINHPETRRIAKLLGIDSADAVTGFTFKGRHGTANVNGAVIPTPCCEAVEAVIEIIESQRIEAEAVNRSQEALRGWKRFMSALRIQERVKGYQIEGEIDSQEGSSKDPAVETATDSDDGHASAAEDEDTSGSEFNASDSDSSEEGEGGFLADDAEETRPNQRKELSDIAEPGMAFVEQIRNTRDTLPSYTIIHGPPLPLDEPTSSPQQPGYPITSDTVPVGGFIHEDDGPGGFLPEEGSEAVESSFAQDRLNVIPEDLFEDPLISENSRNSAHDDSIQDADNARMLQEIHDLDREQGEANQLSGQEGSREGASPGKAKEELENEPQSGMSEEEDEVPLEDPEEEDADPEWLV